MRGVMPIVMGKKGPKGDDADMRSKNMMHSLLRVAYPRLEMCFVIQRWILPKIMIRRHDGMELPMA